MYKNLILLVVLAVTIACVAGSVLAPSRLEEPFTNSSGSSVPMIIVQTHRYKRLDDVPSPLHEIMSNLRDAHPEWEYRYYNDDEQREFIERHMSTRVLAAYDAINPAYSAARADLFRYVVVYVNGGVYLDCKSGLTLGRSLDLLRLEGRLVTAHWNRIRPHASEVGLPHGEYVNWCIAAPPSDPMLLATIDRVVENIEREQQLPESARGTGKLSVLRITGPIAFTQASLAKHRELYGTAPPTRRVREYGLQYTANGKHPDKMKPWHYERQTGPVVLNSDVA